MITKGDPPEMTQNNNNTDTACALTMLQQAPVKKKLSVQTEKSVRVVVARYSEPLDWLLLIPEGYEIYVSNSGEDAPFIPKRLADSAKLVQTPNGGREAGHWLRYIVDNYENLADIQIFLQGLPHVGHTVDILLGDWLERHYFEPRLIQAKGFSYIYDQSEKRVSTGGNETAMTICYALGRKFLPLPPPLSGSDWGGQHYVTKDVIRSRPLEFYKGLIEYGCSPDETNEPMVKKFPWTLERTYNVLYGIWPD